MKNVTKRILLATATLLVAAAVQWVSGLAFQRSPGEAIFALFGVVLAAHIALFPFPFDEDVA